MREREAGVSCDVPQRKNAVRQEKRNRIAGSPANGGSAGRLALPGGRKGGGFIETALPAAGGLRPARRHGENFTRTYLPFFPAGHDNPSIRSK